MMSVGVGCAGSTQRCWLDPPASNESTLRKLLSWGFRLRQRSVNISSHWIMIHCTQSCMQILSNSVLSCAPPTKGPAKLIAVVCSLREKSSRERKRSAGAGGRQQKVYQLMRICLLDACLHEKQKYQNVIYHQNNHQRTNILNWCIFAILSIPFLPASQHSLVYITLFNYLNRMRGSSQKHKLARKPSASSKDTPSQSDKEERLQELRSKIEKEREAMRKTGKRFGKNDETLGSQRKISVEVGTEEATFDRNKMTTPFFKKESKVMESTAKQQPPTKEETTQKIQKQQPQPQPQRTNIKLGELIPSSSQKSISLSSSRIFQKEVDEQKNRNIEIQRFLNNIGLGNYAEGLINMGYDELEVLMEVKAEELNFLMMRAAHQKRLMEALGKLREQAGGPQQQEKSQPLMGLPSFFKARAGIKPPPKKDKQKQQQSQPQRSTSFLLSRPKSALTQTSTIPTNNSQLFTNTSFFCSIGGNNWSMQSLVRRACSSCFKVLPSSELQQKDECYYCKACCKMEEDVLGLTLSGFLRREIKDKEVKDT